MAARGKVSGAGRTLKSSAIKGKLRGPSKTIKPDYGYGPRNAAVAPKHIPGKK